jgi:tryptophan synthase alpha chain
MQIFINIRLYTFALFEFKILIWRRLDMNRIEKTFKELKLAGQKGLVTYITAGDPDMETTVNLLKTLPASGADIIELGIPFSDPMADGPIIQQASQRALSSGTTLKGVLDAVRSFRVTDTKTPLVLMGYYNPIYRYGTERFAADASKAGVDGIIVVDLPPEEDSELSEPLAGSEMNLIRLVTPTTTEQRFEKIKSGAGGFLYMVSITGITGTASPEQNILVSKIKMIRENTNLPTALGFGIKTAQDVKNLKNMADAIVVGSSIVNTIGQSPDSATAVERVSRQVNELAAALK